MALHPESLPCYFPSPRRKICLWFIHVLYTWAWLPRKPHVSHMFPGFLCFSSPCSAVSGKPNKRAAGCRRHGRPHGRPREVPPWPRIQRWRRYGWWETVRLIQIRFTCHQLSIFCQFGSDKFMDFTWSISTIGLRMNPSSPFRMVISKISCLNMYQLMMSTLLQWFIPIARRSTRFQPCCHYDSLCI